MNYYDNSHYQHHSKEIWLVTKEVKNDNSHECS